jgi:hypothetical protein
VVSLQDRIKNSLNEARMLMLGAMVPLALGLLLLMLLFFFGLWFGLTLYHRKQHGRPAAVRLQHRTG